MGMILTFLLKQWKVVLLIASAIVIYWLFTSLSGVKKENDRLSTNVTVLNKNYTSYKTAFGYAAAKVEALTYTQEEMSVYESNLENRIKELKIKPKNVISAAQIGTSSGVTIKTVIQYVDSSKCFTYSDKFNNVSGCFRGDSVDVNIESFDSLTTVVSKIPKHRFLWWSWGVKAIQLNILSQNPDTKFTYLKYVEVK